jgi:general secretion pathway protein F
MGEWRYTAIDRTGQTTAGSLQAEDEAEVMRHLRRQGAIPVQLVPPGRTSALAGLLAFEFGRSDALTRQDVTALLRELATMLGAGQDLDRALRFLVDTAANARIRRVAAALRDAVRDGSALAAAMAAQPRSFSRLTIGLVRAGEAGGTLAPTLERLASLMERERSLTATVQSAMIYPALLLTAATGAIALLLTQVLPQFVPLFEQNGAQLPASTRLLIAAGDAVAADGPAVLLGLAVLLLAARVALRRPGPRLAFDRLRLRLPLFGGLAREAMAARLCRTLGTLLQNGVALIPALVIVREVLGNEAGARGLDQAALSARGGAGLAVPLEQTRLFPARMIHLLRLGEETAQLGTMALRAAEIHEERTRIVTQRLVSLLTPAITIVMGAVIAGIVSSLLLAMLSLNDLAQQ